jgi:hypothetical protein
VTIVDDEETLTISFPEWMQYDIHSLKRDPPSSVRVERFGSDIVVKTPTAFVEWLGEYRPARPEEFSLGFETHSRDDYFALATAERSRKPEKQTVKLHKRSAEEAEMCLLPRVQYWRCQNAVGALVDCCQSL